MTIKQKFNMLYAPILVFILVVGIIAYVLQGSGTTVMFSSSTGECIKVVTSKESYSCKNTQMLYSKVLVD